MKILKKGDRCPCCGEPIKTDDKDVLLLLSWVADKGRLPNFQEIADIYRDAHPEANDKQMKIP